MPEKTFYVIAADDIDAWWTDAEEFIAIDAAQAARLYCEQECIGDEFDADVNVVVASNRDGTDARRYKVGIEIIREYWVSTRDEEAEPVKVPDDPDDGPNDHFDMDDDEEDEAEADKVKGTEDDQTLDLF